MDFDQADQNKLLKNYMDFDHHLLVFCCHTHVVIFYYVYVCLEFKYFRDL